MASIFGSIIAIAVSVAVILVFRQIDSSNRSLEKVKKYTDKVRGDLDGYFHEQTEKLDNAAVSLKVEQQKAVATISRLNEMYSEFETRSKGFSEHTSAIDAVQDKINGYDASLKELMEMTGRLEENLESLRKDSSFVQSLSKKIEAQRSQFESLEKRIPGLQASFDKTNKENLAAASSETLDKFHATVKILEFETDNAISKNAEILAEINRSIESAYANAAEKADKLDAQAFSILNEKAKARQNDFSEKTNAYIQKLSDDTESRIGQLESTCASRFDELQQTVETQLSSFQESISSTEDKYTDAVRAVDDKYQEYEDEARRASGRFDTELSNANGILTELKNTIDEKTSAINAQLESVFQKAAGNSLELGKKAEQSFTSLLNENLSDLQNKTEERLSTFKTETESKISDIQNAAEEQLVSFQSGTNAKILDIQNTANENFTVLQNTTNDQINTIQKQINENIVSTREELDAEIKKLDSYVQTTFSGWQAKALATANDYSEKADEIQKVYKTAADSVGGQFAEIQEKTHQFIQLLEDRTNKNTTQLDQLQQDVAQKTSEIINRMDTVFETAAKRASEMEDGAYRQFEQQSISRQSENKASYENQFQAMQSTIQKVFEQLKGQFEKDSEETKSLANSYRQDWQSQAEKLLESFNNEVSKNSDIYSHTVKELDDRFKAYELSTGNQAESIRNAISQNASTLEQMNSSCADEISAVTKKLKSSLDEALKKHDSDTTSFFADMENQLEMFKANMVYRYERLDNAAGELDGLEKNLRKSMDQTEERVNSDFQVFICNQQTAQNDFEKTIQNHSNEISSHIQSLEGELNELKKRAYDNVSEKLKIFEDDFAADLTKRGNNIDESFADWKASFDSRLESVSAKGEEERNNLEIQYTDELKKGLASIQEHSKEQSMRFEEALKASNENIRQKIDGCDKALHDFIEQYKQDLENAKLSADAYLKKELDSEAGNIDSQLVRFERDINTRLESLVGQVSETNEKTDGVVQGIMGDFSSWQERVAQQFEETKNIFSTKLAGLEQSAGELISQVKNSFEADVTGFKAQSEEERSQITNQLEQLKADSTKSIADYETRSAGIIDEFKKAYADVADDNQKRIREQNSDTEQKLRALRALVQEIREKNEESQEKMVLKMQGDANKLNTTMDDIDARLKQFVSQTRVFDKADELKTNLENQIGTLKAEIAKVEPFHEEASAVEQQFARIKKLEEDLNQKLQRFNEEKKHLDALEVDFNKLVALSDSMDTKILELQSSNDDIQNVQAQVRGILKTVNDSAAKYERLEKKIPVLDQTAADIDQSFENLKQIETRLNECSEQTEQIPLQLESVKRDVERLVDNTTKINDVVSKLDSLDSVLGETESRIQKVESTKDWIVRTETRLEEISKQAESELRLIGDLTKGARERQNANVGAPSIATRENIRKLAHSGWKPEEIAAKLNESLAAVELVLEMEDKS